jgi:hypothetical protein
VERNKKLVAGEEDQIKTNEKNPEVVQIYISSMKRRNEKRRHKDTDNFLVTVVVWRTPVIN